LAVLKRRASKVYKEARKLFRVLEKTPDLGYPLEDEWEGCFAVHVGSDRYRVIWEILPPVDDYAGASGDQVIPVVVLRVGPKTDEYKRTIYEQPRPPADS
jgi:hypothetical protein